MIRIVFGILALASLPPAAHIQSKEINESSGLVASRKRKGIFWTHNDSGDSARLFAIRLDGSVVEERAIEGARNVDWEDIAIDGETLWIDDAGNNGNARKDLSLYAVSEKGGKAAQYLIAYPDQDAFPPKGERRFDCEAIFVRKHRVFLITKWRNAFGLPGNGGSLYRLDNPSIGRVNLLTKLGTFLDFGGWVTAADLSPNGKELAVLVHLPSPAIWIFDANVPDERLLSKPIAHRRYDTPATAIGQAESLAWNGDKEIVFGNEEGDLFRVLRKDIPAIGSTGR